MIYESELRLLCDVFKKSHVRAAIISDEDLRGGNLDEKSGFESGGAVRKGEGLESLFQNLEPKTVYKITDSYRRDYVYLRLPGQRDGAMLLIGPYLDEPISNAEIMEIGETNGISPRSQRHLSEYYSGLAVVSGASPLLDMLHTFCEHIWKSPSFSIVDMNEGEAHPSPIIGVTGEDGLNDVLVNMRAMEKRYSFENELMDAVRHGQLHKEKQLLAAFSDDMFEKRAANPLRNAQNYCIIMNTLLRKAAESGGVHPMYLDRISSEFAMKIEKLPSLSKNAALMKEMFSSYCRLVRKHSIRDYSPVVQKAILIIDSDISANLSLATLAAAEGISCGYLATVFKKETGKTVSEYIREKRIKHAIHLLSATHLQVQTVALHCGIMDVQYFSKIFKRETGKTPREYREKAMHGQNT